MWIEIFEKRTTTIFMERTDSEIIISNTGERAAMTGYVPQYDEFAIGVYNALKTGDLEEIRVADIENNVGKLDDIVYVTSQNVYAYQLKWTNTSAMMSYSEFRGLIHDIVEGWRNLKNIYPDKIVLPKLLTNKKLTDNDSTIKRLVDKDAGGFVSYEREIIQKLKTKTAIDEKWAEALKELRRESGLVDEEWNGFWDTFEFVFGYEQELIEIAKAWDEQRVLDIISIHRVIEEMAARKQVVLTSRELLVRLGWPNRFTTIFNHNLIVPLESYVPNAKGIEQLSECLQGKTKGYIFLKGTPGSGKSTLLTQWTRGLANPSVRFYAFDFLNPSSHANNDSSRGTAITFLNDIIKLIQEAGIMRERTMPLIKEFSVLKSYFYNQLIEISKNYQNGGLPFLVVVDGLDHITREYHSNRDSLMEALPSVADLPEGVIFVLGSQHFDNLNLHQSIEKEYKNKANLVEIPPLSKEESNDLCGKLLVPDLIAETVLEKCWTKSQGHPLYLRYLLNQISVEGVDVLEKIGDMPEEVDDYYGRIIGTLLDKPELRNAIGLLSRISGVIKLSDLRALTQGNALVEIKNNLRHLFIYDKAGQELSFFHNSFRQYLLNKTSEDIFTDSYSCSEDIAYYRRLAEYFIDGWDRGYYLYKAEEYDKFIEEINPDYLYSQIQNYRPLWSVRRDVECGVSIAKERKDPYLLVRYLLFENQLSQMGNQDFSVLSLVDDFIGMGRGSLAKAIVREGGKLHCSQNDAMDTAIEFLEHGDKDEAELLFELSYPDFLSRSPEEHHNVYYDLEEKTKVLTDWVKTAGFFISWTDIEKRISQFIPFLQSFAEHDKKRFNASQCEKEFVGAYLESLVIQQRWEELNDAISGRFSDKNYNRVEFKACDDAIVQLSEVDPLNEWIGHFFSEAERIIDCFEESSRSNLRMSYLALKAGQPNDKVASYIQKVEWKDLGSFYQSRSGQFFNTFSAHLYYVKTRAQLGIRDELLNLVPDDDTDKDNVLMVSYARRLFAVAQMFGRTHAGDIDYSFLSHLRFCIRSFDTLHTNHHNKYSYTLSRQRRDYYEYLVKEAGSLGSDLLDEVAHEFEYYFADRTCKADADSKRMVFQSLFREGYDKEWCKEQLLKVESTMFDNQDVDGRELECLKQGRGWLEMGYRDLAENCFHSMIEESFGIGYRKDSQPTLFAEWIGSALKDSPEQAIKYIHWLTSRLKHIETVAEMKTCQRAASALLEETLKFNLRSGIKLAIWLLDKEYDYFQSVSASLVRALLSVARTKVEYNALFRYFTDIHLYVDDNYVYDLNTSLLKYVTIEGKRVLGEEYADSEALLKLKIKTECPENIADGLIKSLEEQPESKEQTYHRESDSKLAEAKDLLARGERSAAWAKAIEAVETSSSFGWAVSYDGGTRINSCCFLQHLDKERGRDFTIQLFARDILEGNSYGTMLYLDEVVPLLVKSVDQKRLFAEEFAYMNRILREEDICEEDKPELEPDDSTVCDILRDWLLYLTQMPVICVMERAKIQLAHLYNESNIELVC